MFEPITAISEAHPSQFSKPAIVGRQEQCMTIPLETAKQIVTEARFVARNRGFKPLTIVVLDAGGNVVAAEREDDSSTKRFEIAFAKAHGALALGMGTRALMSRAEQQPYFISAAASAIGGSLIPVPGGVLVRNADKALVGAVGVSGETSDNDEAAAIAGIEAVELVAQPD
ncbi:heme-binding protein [Rhodococcus sp. NPDC057529]|uniref:GlcG/HbpS family heme-binding protein n=1 Tax=Rhodococcus sp. NPDC057529 TaxID=3346158 RepID=UPI00366B168C